MSLNLLLFVRHSWTIAHDVDIPTLSPAPDLGASKMPVSSSSDEWTERWILAWERTWSWYKIQEPNRSKHPTQELLRQVLRPGQELHPLVPPLWTTEYDRDGLDFDAFNYWQNSLIQIPPSEAERRNLADLIPAWESGVDSIIVLPYEGYFARRVTHRHIAVSAATRNDPLAYGRALQQIARS
ncbi:hypothetical protein [Paenarthrobacter sp. NPDC018779]|uniref:hypothetical protein n=1 Tax=Paenarthrobacter sp. NPDC018779 TaxID=3364375 RepID=UPI0037C87E34